jgi:hypothetical protein
VLTVSYLDLSPHISGIGQGDNIGKLRMVTGVLPVEISLSCRLSTCNRKCTGTFFIE